MKVQSKCKGKKSNIKTKTARNAKLKKEQILIVAQEIKFARLLSGNDKKTRDRVLKALKKWILNCFEKKYNFKEDDFTRVWKGLFYAVWMSDKPLVQEELCDRIASFLDLFSPEEIHHAVLMVKAGLRVLATEWYGIDQHRMDKFLMLVRRYLRSSLRCLCRCNWSLESVTMFSDILTSCDGILCVKTPLFARNSTSMILHFIDCYLEEIAKVSEGNIPATSLCELLRPISAYMCSGQVEQICVACRRVFTELVRQSDLGIQYQDKAAAWQQMGCPQGGPDALELASDDESDGKMNGQEEFEEKGALDPRAGHVDVILPCLPVPSEEIAKMLRLMLSKVGLKAHRRARICLERFEQLSKNVYPLRLKESDLDLDVGAPIPKTKIAVDLHRMEAELVADSDELALKGLSRKQRKKLLAKSRTGASILNEVPAKTQRKTKNNNNGQWKVEEIGDSQKLDKPHKEAKKRRLLNKDIDENSKVKIKETSDKSRKDHNDKKRKKINDETEKRVESTPKKVKYEKPLDKEKKSIEDRKITKIIKSKQEDSKSIALVFKGNHLRTKKLVEISPNSCKIQNKLDSKKLSDRKSSEKPTFVAKKVKTFKKKLSKDKLELVEKKHIYAKALNKESIYSITPKKVKFVLKNNSMQGPVDYYKSVRKSPSIPFDSNKQPTKTNLKPSTPSPINPFFKKKMKVKL